MIYYRKTLFGSGPKLTAVHNQHQGSRCLLNTGSSQAYVIVSAAVLAHFYSF